MKTIKGNLITLAILICFWPTMTLAQIEFEKLMLQENSPEWVLNPSIQITSKVIVNDDLNPFYLVADFNGQGQSDVAFSVRHKVNGKRGILIVHQETRRGYVLGAGTEMDAGGDDWKWLEVWKIYDKPWAYATLFSDDYDIVGDERVALKHIGLEISSSEAASNLVVWDGLKYVWIHTGE